MVTAASPAALLYVSVTAFLTTIFVQSLKRRKSVYIYRMVNTALKIDKKSINCGSICTNRKTINSLSI